MHLAGAGFRILQLRKPGLPRVHARPCTYQEYVRKSEPWQAPRLRERRITRIIEGTVPRSESVIKEEIRMHPKLEKSKSESTHEEQQVPILYIAVDISKEYLDVNCAGKYQRFPNTTVGINKLSKLARSHVNARTCVVYESTGWLSLQLAIELTKRDVEQICINPAWLRKWALGMGFKAKTDKIDCEVIARYAQVRELKPNVSSNENILKLRQLVSVNTYFSRALAKTRALLEIYKNDSNILDLHKASIEHFKQQKKQTEQMMQAIIDSDKELNAKYKFYLTLPGVGPCVARALIAMMPELGTLNRGQAASLVGVAPFNKESGQTNGKRVPRYGRKAVRSLLHQSVLSLIHCSPNPIQNFYNHLLARKVPVGKALIACIRRLIILLNAQARDWLASRQISTESA